MSTILEIKNLSFAYDKSKLVLDDVSFAVRQGTITALLGKNGCGKSTLLDCILGLNEYKNGNILLEGKEIKDYSPKDLSKKVAYISQNTVINIDYSVREFVLFGRTPYIKFGNTPSKDDYLLVEKFAEECGISHLLNKDINKISGGEKQLAFLCRALVQNPDLFIFDEPTSSLDFGNQYRLFDMMKKLQSEGKTILFTTHNPNQVLELNCNVVLLNDSHIIASGLADGVLTEAVMKDIYEMSFKKSQNGFNYYN